MKRPHLNRKLLLEAATRVADGAGGFTETWTALGEVWAEMSARSGREAMDGRTAVSRVVYRIAVRAAPVGAPSRPSPGQRLRDGDRIYAIHAVAERGHDGRYLTCFAVEELAT